MNNENLNQEKQEKVLNLRDKLADDFDTQKAQEFMCGNEDKSWYSDFALLYEMVIDSKYRLELKTKIAIAGTLAYVILPIDVIPDFIPFVGWVDDIFVLGYTMNAISEEIQKYKEFKNDSILS